ncbi:MAG: lysophospholipase [Actinomycetota bacterium]|nr:lysophospholipase [Actinomycetota bacterium]
MTEDDHRPDPPTLTLATTDGVDLLIRRWAADRPRAVVVLVHGFAASTIDRAVERQAEALVAARYDVLSYDSRGHGRSNGRCTLGDLERHDVAAAVNEAGGDGRAVILVGASMGAIAALRYAASADAHVEGVVAVSCPATWRAPRSAQGVLATGLTQTRVGRAMALRLMSVRVAPGWSDPLPPVSLVERIDVPVAIVHGSRDRFIPPGDGAELHRHGNDPRRLDVVPGMGHAYGVLAVAPVVAATDWTLAQASAPVA